MIPSTASTTSPDDTGETSPSGRRKRRTLRACDGCRHRRMKCEDVQTTASGKQRCRVCRDNRQDCTFNAPVLKRGPRPGWRQRLLERSISPAVGGSSSNSLGLQHDEQQQRQWEPTSSSSGEAAAQQNADRTRRRQSSPSPDRQVRSRHQRVPLLGLPPPLVDQLLAVYFTHVHNVWPLIYKPSFNPHTASAPLLLAMLSIAACVAHPDPKYGLDGNKLFHMAERALHHCRMENRIDIIQSLILLSLRQTGNGDKNLAFTYAGRACCMALSMGLNLAPAQPESPVDAETRSRVYWNCYVLDKTLAEETGRSIVLPYRRSSTPLPSMTEADEFELWPPMPSSSQPLPESVRHLTPRRGFVMSCFVWTCYLGMIVEGILELDVPGPPRPQPNGTPWFNQWSADKMETERKHVVSSASRIARELESWREALPSFLEVDPDTSPMPHLIISLAWYETAQILLYSHFIRNGPIPDMLSPGASAEHELVAKAHSTCTAAAEKCAKFIAQLDDYKLLSVTSSDIIHILGLVTLYEAFDASDPDPELAHRAKVTFAQCCIWLRDCSSAWPAASAHKVFFEGLIQGGIKLSSTIHETESSPQPLDAGLRGLGNKLRSPRTDFGTTLPPLGRSSLFQLPQFYWNQLSNAIPGQTTATFSAEGNNLGIAESPDMTFLPPALSPELQSQQSAPSPYPPQRQDSQQDFQLPPPQHQAQHHPQPPQHQAPQHQAQQQQAHQHQQDQHQQQSHEQGQQMQQQQQQMGNDQLFDMMNFNQLWNGGAIDANLNSSMDNSAVYSALMNFMVEAARSR